MFFLKVFTVLLLANCISAGPVDDEECGEDCDIVNMKRIFVEGAAGVPEVGMKPMDPMVVKNINFPEESLDINTYFPELKVTGLKDVVINSFSKVEDKGVVIIDLKYNMVADGPVSVQFPKKNKDLRGTMRYEAVINGLISFPFSKANGKNVIGDPTFSCESSNAKASFSEEFIQVVAKDPDASAVKADFDKIRNEHMKKVTCEINKAVFTVVVENLRALSISVS